MNREKEFKACVARHMTTLDQDDWEHFRAWSWTHKPMCKELGPAQDLAPAELADAALMEDSIEMEESIEPWLSEAVQVGHVDGRAVMYVPSQGIYAWPTEENRTLSIYLTFPAYPPNY